MKKSIFLILTIFLTLISCERNNSDNYSDPVLIIGENLEFSYNDFELYDSSTHMLYFKTAQPEIVNPEQSSFELYADSVMIYKGKYWSGFQSSFPSDPFISKHPFFYPNYVIRFEYVGQGNDPRNDSRLISAFKNHGLLHSGLSAEITGIDIDGSHLSFSFTVTNKDKSDLLVLDPEKMGLNLFHYFTNAPVFFNTSQNKSYNCHIEYQSPPSGSTWESDWLSELKSGASRQFTFDYTVELPFAPGNYKVWFEFPGLSHQISRDQLYQGNKRIWLGDIPVTRLMRIN